MNCKKDNKKTPRLIHSSSNEETHRIGIEIGKTLSAPGLVLLRGTLGTGKTTLARGIAEGLGLADSDRVCSPSFTLINVYHGRCPIYHVDLYRLSGARDLYLTGIDDFIGKDGVTIVEWSERLTELFPGAYEPIANDMGARAPRLRVPKKAGKMPAFPATPEGFAIGVVEIEITDAGGDSRIMKITEEKMSTFL